MNYIWGLFLLTALAAPTLTQSDSSSRQSSVNNNVITSKYDAGRNETTVFISQFLRLDPGYQSDIGVMAISASFTYAGQTKATPPAQVELKFLSVTQVGWMFRQEEERKLTIIVDDEVLLKGSVERTRTMKQSDATIFNDPRAPNYTEPYLYHEFLSALIPSESFIKLASSRKAVVQLGRKKLKLSPRHLSAFHRLAKAMSS